MKTVKYTDVSRIEGRIDHENISINTEERDVQLRVEVPENGVLSKKETATKLRIVGDNFHFLIDLDSVELDQLEGGIHYAQEHLMEKDV